MKDTAIFLCMLVLGASAIIAQPRTVTNIDLEKYKRARLVAEKDLAERYKELGFPSPDELRQRVEKDRAEREALTARLFDELLRQERADTEREAATRRDDVVQYYYPDQAGGRLFYYSNGFYPGYYWPRRVRQFSPPISVGNGIPVVNYYGTPSIGRPRPIFRTGRR